MMRKLVPDPSYQLFLSMAFFFIPRGGRTFDNTIHSCGFKSIPFFFQNNDAQPVPYQGPIQVLSIYYYISKIVLCVALTLVFKNLYRYKLSCGRSLQEFFDSQLDRVFRFHFYPTRKKITQHTYCQDRTKNPSFPINTQPDCKRQHGSTLFQFFCLVKLLEVSRCRF